MKAVLQYDFVYSIIFITSFQLSEYEKKFIGNKHIFPEFHKYQLTINFIAVRYEWHLEHLQPQSGKILLKKI